MSRPHRSLALAALSVLLCTSLAADAEALSPLWAGLTPGHYTVGYQRIDGSTTVHVWYPAEPGGAPPTWATSVLPLPRPDAIPQLVSPIATAAPSTLPGA